MSFTASLEFGSLKVKEIQSCSYSFSRDVDHKGRPASVVYGGTVSISIESTDSNAVLESMVNNKHKAVDGKVIFFKRDEAGATMKELSWVDGYVIAFSESLDAVGKQAMSIHFTVSAREIKIGNAAHVNEWPKAS